MAKGSGSVHRSEVGQLSKKALEAAVVGSAALSCSGLVGQVLLVDESRFSGLVLSRLIASGPIMSVRDIAYAPAMADGGNKLAVAVDGKNVGYFLFVVPLVTKSVRDDALVIASRVIATPLDTVGIWRPVSIVTT